nr:MAG TPA: hypothetical protein [Caudoviricetes sp.]
MQINSNFTFNHTCGTKCFLKHFATYAVLVLQLS